MAVIRSNNFVSAAVVIIASATVRTRLAAPSGSWLAAMRSAGPAAMLEPMMWLLAGGGWAAAGKEPLWQAGRLVDGAGSGEPGPGDRSRGGLGRALSGALAEVGAEVVGIDLPGTAVRSTRRGIDPMSSATQDRPAAPVDRRWLVLVVVAIAQLMVVLDSTVVNVALPSAQRSLGFSNGDRQWVVTAYALAFGSLLLVGGRLGDMYSRKWVFITGLAGFAVSSAIGGCGRLVRDAGGGPASWTAPLTIGSLVFGVLLLAAFVVAERWSSHPLLPLHVIVDRTRGGSYVAVGLSGIAIFGVFLFLTYYLQEVKGYSPVTSGLAFLPMIGCILLSSNVSSIVTLPRLGPRVLITTGMLLGAGAMTYLTQLTVTSSYAGSILPALLIMGLGFGMIFAPAINTATAGVRRQDSGVASALVNTMQQVGGSIGTAALSTIALTATASYLAAHHTGPLAPAIAATRGYTAAFAVSAGIFGLGVILAIVLLPSRQRLAELSAAAAAEALPPAAAPAPAAAAHAAVPADLAPQLEAHAIHAIPVAVPCCSPVIKPASLPAGRPAG